MAISVLLLFAVTLFATSEIISRGFQDIENQKVRENLTRVIDTYKFDLNNVSSKLSDWSAWDDTYRFISDHNKAYIESNLVYSSLTNLGINYMIFVDQTGNIVEKIGIDPKSKGGLNGVPDDLVPFVSTGSAILNHKDVDSQLTGLILLREGPLMFASRPIVTSNGMGPIKGTVIFGKYLDDSAIKNLSDITHLQIQIARADKDLPDDFKTAYIYLQKGQDFITPENISVIRGYSQLNDFFGKPAEIIRIDYPRDITNEGSRSIGVFFLAFVITGFIFLLVLAFLLNWFLIGRIERLSEDVAKIGEEGIFTARLEEKGKDEFSSLSKNINKMLDRIVMSQNELKSEKAKVDTFFDIVPGVVIILSIGGKILSINKKGCEFLGLTEESALGKIWLDFIPEKDREWVRHIFEEILSKDMIGKYEYLEYSINDKEGNPHIFGWYNSVLRDQNGQIVATVSHGEDIAKMTGK